jgi:hypothetical protein
VGAINKSQNWYIESQSLRQHDALFVNTYENTSITLTCEIESSRMNENVVWHYFQLDKDATVVNKFQLSNFDGRANSVSGAAGAKRVSNLDKQKRFYSHLNLYNVTMNNSGYYVCSINTVLKDDLNQTLFVKANATYYLQVQCKYANIFLSEVVPFPIV